MIDYIYSTPDGHCYMICARLAIGGGTIKFINDTTLCIRSDHCLPNEIIVDEYYLRNNPYEMLTCAINLIECIHVYKYVISFEVKLMNEMNMVDHEEMVINSFFGYRFQDTFEYIPPDSSDESITYEFTGEKLNLYLHS